MTRETGNSKNLVYRRMENVGWRIEDGGWRMESDEDETPLGM